MTDSNRKFKSVAAAFEDLGAALEQIIDDLTQLLEPEMDCESCGDQDAECPDCEKDYCDEEADYDV